MLLLAVVAAVAVLIGLAAPGRLPARGGPGLPLPLRAAPARGIAAAHRRASARRSRRSWPQTPGVESYNTVVGFSLLSQVNATYNAFFFVTLKEWGERTAPEEQLPGDHART